MEPQKKQIVEDEEEYEYVKVPKKKKVVVNEESEEDMEDRRKKTRAETVSIIKPGLMAILGLAIIVFVAWALDYLYATARFAIIHDISSFLNNNLHIFFGAFIIFGYNEYLNKVYPNEMIYVRPIVSGLAAAFVIWIMSWALKIISAYTPNSIIASVASNAEIYMWPIAVIVIAIGYVIVLAKKMF